MMQVLVIRTHVADVQTDFCCLGWIGTEKLAGLRNSLGFFTQSKQ